MMVIAVALEAISVGLVFPLIALISDPLRADRLLLKYLSAHQESYLGAHQGMIFVIGMCLLAVIVIFKNIFLATLAWAQAKFSFELQYNISRRLFEIYLSQPYEYHLHHNSAQLIRNITTEVNSFTFYVVLPSLYFLAEMLMIAGLGALLFYIEPFGALISLVILMIAGWFFQKLTYKSVKKNGLSRQYHEGKRIQHLQQGLGGVKEIKLLNRGKEFIDRYRVHAELYSKTGRLHVTLQQIPRLWIEVLAIVGLLLLVISIYLQGKQIETVLPVISLFAAAAFRLLPSISRAMTSMQTIKFAQPVVDLMTHEFLKVKLLPASKSSVGSQDVVFKDHIELRDVNFTFSQDGLKTLKNINLRISAGQIIGIFGESGSGKSTLIDVIMGLLPPATGAVYVDGQNLLGREQSWGEMIGYVPQAIFITDDSILKNIAFGIPEPVIDMQKIERAIDSAQLSEFINSLPEGLDTVVGERGVRLSGGQRQRIGLARALYHNPEVLVLDEATSALDEFTEIGVMNAIGALRKKVTIIIVAHRLSTFKYCDTIYRLDGGAIKWAGQYNELGQDRP